MRRQAAFVLASLLAAAALAVPVVSAMWHEADAEIGQVTEAADDPGKPAGSDESPADDQDAGPAAERNGPPPWARSVTKDKHDERGLASWKRLTPEQREDLMTRLARDHRAGMKAYRACRSDGHPNCEKPLPPGLAKRQ
jgi:Spy/CpxP family protein refolding chaperone